jgi:hypothetical protein
VSAAGWTRGIGRAGRNVCGASRAGAVAAGTKTPRRSPRSSPYKGAGESEAEDAA